MSFFLEQILKKEKYEVGKLSKLSWLKKETERWVSREIIRSDQADDILGLYPAENKNRLISALLLLGAILVGAGIILFFASNWQYIPKWGKVSLVLAPLVLFHLASHLTYDSLPGLSRALSLLGCIMFGSGIWLIAQVFHINAHFPNGILFWLLGVLPVAFLLKEELPLGLGSLLLGAWVLAEQSSAPAVVMIALLLFGAVFYLTYALKSPFALIVTLISSIVFVNTEVLLILLDNYNFVSAAFIIPFVSMLTGFSMVFMSVHPVNKIKHFPFIYSFLGIVVTGISLFIMSLESFSRHFVTLYQNPGALVFLWVLYAAAAVFGAYALSRTTRDFKTMARENTPWLILDTLAFVMLLIPFGEFSLTVLLNLVMFLWALSVIVTGFMTQNSLYFSLGMIAFNLYIVGEYFNFFWKMLSKSLFFIAGGVVLIASGAIMERQRRKVILSWGKGEVTVNEEKP